VKKYTKCYNIRSASLQQGLPWQDWSQGDVNLWFSELVVA
jgi:hypothetical protein